MSEIWYDKKEDVLDKQEADGKYWKSEVSKNVLLELSNDWKIIGVEVFPAKRHLKRDARSFWPKPAQLLEGHELGSNPHQSSTLDLDAKAS